MENMEGLPEDLPDDKIFFKTGEYSMVVPANSISIDFIVDILTDIREKNIEKRLRETEGTFKKEEKKITSLIDSAEHAFPEEKKKKEGDIAIPVKILNETICQKIMEHLPDKFTTEDAKKLIVRLHNGNITHGNLLTRSCICLGLLEKQGIIERTNISKHWKKTGEPFTVKTKRHKKDKNKPASSSEVEAKPDDQSTPTEQQVCTTINVETPEEHGGWIDSDLVMLKDNYDDVDKILRLKLIKGKTRDEIEEKIEELGLVSKTIESTLLSREEMTKKERREQKTQELASLVKKRRKEEQQ